MRVKYGDLKIIVILLQPIHTFGKHSTLWKRPLKKNIDILMQNQSYWTILLSDFFQLLRYLKVLRKQGAFIFKKCPLQQHQLPNGTYQRANNYNYECWNVTHIHHKENSSLKKSIHKSSSKKFWLILNKIYQKF